MHSGIFSGRAINKYPSFLLSNMSSLDLSLVGLKIPQLWLNITVPRCIEAMSWCKGKNFHQSIGKQGSEKKIQAIHLINTKERTVCKNQHWLVWQYLWRTGSQKVLSAFNLQGLAFGMVRELSNMIRKRKVIGKGDVWKEVNYPKTRNE